MNRKQLLTTGLLILTLAAFWPVTWAEFITYDDPIYVTNNPYVFSGLTARTVAWDFAESLFRAGFWVPFIWLSLQLDATLFGLGDAWGFHLTNLLLHTANVGLLFLLLQRATGDCWRSAIVAALFGLHPMRVESVAWVTERKDVLSTLFVLLTIAAYGWYVHRPGWRRFTMVMLCFVLALTAKPTVVTLPLGLLLLDYWPLGRLRLGQAVAPSSIPAVPWRVVVLEKLPLLAASAVVSALTVFLHASIKAVATLEGMGLGDRVRSALAAYLGYLEKTFCPVDLAMLYPSGPVALSQAVVSAVVLLLITALALGFRRTIPALIVGWLWFLGILFPVSGIVQAGPQMMADRYSYVPHFGLFAMLVWGASELALRLRIATWAPRIALPLLVIPLVCLTWQQSCRWQNGETIFLHTLEVTKDNHIIHCALGATYMRRGDSTAAEPQYRRAVEIFPDARNLRDYARVLIENDRNAAAREQVQRALQHEPTNPETLYLLGVAAKNLGDWQTARASLSQALGYWQESAGPIYRYDNQDQVDAHLKLAQIELRDGNVAAALQHCHLALNLDSQSWECLELSGIALLRLGSLSDAESRLRQALAVNPNATAARSYLAYVQGRQGRTSAAEREYAMLRASFPDFPARYNQLALMLLTYRSYRDVPRALELAVQANEATGHKNPALLDTLAAALAATGDFAKATETATTALSLADNSDLRQQIQSHLEFYSRNEALPVR